MNLDDQLKRLDEADAAYYNNQSIMSDLAYDLFKDRVLKSLPPEHPRLSKVGHPVCSAWPKETHNIFMGSQNKVCKESEIVEWIDKTLKALNVKKTQFILQYKLDGFSLGVIYEKGKMYKAITRGDGSIGENITPNAKMFRKLPNTIKIPENVTVRGEGLLSKKSYDEIQVQTNDHYKNPRNAASGISRRLDGTHSKYIEVISYDINAKVTSESEKLTVLKELGFSCVDSFVYDNAKDIVDKYVEIRDRVRQTLPFDVDGLVLKVDSIELQEKLGIKDNRPVAQIALKFDSDQVITTIRRIDIQVGRTGKLTPVAILEPVDMMGSTITKASIHNFAYILENGLGVGAEVVIEKKGDIIPQIVEVVNPGTPFDNPTKCPSCGGPLEDDSTNLWCHNSGCKERETSRIIYWTEVLDMKGFSDKFIEKLWSEGKIRSVADLYKLSVSDFDGISGFGTKKVTSFFSTLKGTSEMYLDKFIKALGIPTVSTSTSEDLVKNFGTWEEITKITPNDIVRLPGYADTSAKAICDGIQEIKEMADELLKVITIKIKKSGIFTGKTVCITGELKNMSRKEAEKLVIDNGGSFKGSVTKDLSYLVTNDPDSGSGKNAVAKKINTEALNKGLPPLIQVIDEKQFLAITGKSEEDFKIADETDDAPIVVTYNIFEEN